MKKHLLLIITLLAIMPCTGNATHFSYKMTDLSEMCVIAHNFARCTSIKPVHAALSKCTFTENGSLILPESSHQAVKDAWGCYDTNAKGLILYPAFFQLPEEILIPFARYFSQIKRTKCYYVDDRDYMDMQADISIRYPGFSTFFDIVKASFKENPDALNMHHNDHPFDYTVAENGEVLLCEPEKSL